MSDLHIRLRPQTFDEVYGNDLTIKLLKGALKSGKFPQTLLLTGESGCGKTTIARIVAKSLNDDKDEFLKSPDYIEIDAASNNGVDSIRELQGNLVYKPFKYKKKVVVLDESHMLSSSAQNALLKVLEDTPDHVNFILCTTEPQSLKKTIRTRAVQLGVKCTRLDGFVSHYSELEGLEIPDEVLKAVVEAANGSYRSALILLGSLKNLLQVQESVGVEDLEELIHVIPSRKVVELVDCVLSKSSGKIVEGIRGILDEGYSVDLLVQSVTAQLKDLWLGGKVSGSAIENYFNRLAVFSKLSERFRQDYYELVLISFLGGTKLEIKKAEVKPKEKETPLSQLDVVTRKSLERYGAVIEGGTMFSDSPIPSRIQRKVSQTLGSLSFKVK